MPELPRETARRKRVFVVDDSEENLMVVEAILENAGYIVSTIRDGTGLFGRVFAERPDLVLCDLSMPEVAGTVLTRLLKQVHGDGVRVLLYSSADEAELAAQTVECGADGYVRKSVSTDMLLGRIRDVMELRSKSPR